MTSETPTSAPSAGGIEPGPGTAGASSAADTSAHLHPHTSTHASARTQGHLGETLVGIGIVLAGIGLGIGAKGISSDAGYGGVGPNFVPWLVAVMLVLCGALITWQACTGGFRQLSEEAQAPAVPYWLGFVWVSAGLLLNAGLLPKLGFALGCTLCYTLAVHGLRKADGQAKASAPRTWVTDVLTGLAISLPVYWFFTKFLDINLPGLTGTGWL